MPPTNPYNNFMQIGILTGGGDAPGLNGIIEAACRVLLSHGVQVVGIEDGFEGIFGCRTKKIDLANIENLHSMAGTFLGTSNKSGTAGREQEFLNCWKKLGLAGLLVAGGDGTFAGLKPFASDLKLIGVPKTIDNEIGRAHV